MPNCEWGRPCDCEDCRTVFEKIICPGCGFNNIVSIVREVHGFSQDRKGIGSYDFVIPTEPIKDLLCYKCGTLMVGVGYYTELDAPSCERNIKRDEAILSKRFCTRCNRVEGFDVCKQGLVHLTELDGFNYCQDCYANTIKSRTPDPSDNRTKYTFDENKLTWVPSKIKQACIVCGKERWLNIENRWKKLCTTCYKQQ